MSHNLIIPEGNLEDILARLSYALDLFRLIHGHLDETDVSDPMYGACDLMRRIIKDFEADVNAAEEAAE